jgi:hypothetical protein
MESRDQVATTYAVNTETNYGISGEFVAVMPYLLYKPVIGVGHSTANLPSDRLVTPLAESSNLAPITSTGDQGTTTIAMKLGLSDNTISEFLTVRPYFSIFRAHFFLANVGGHIGSYNTIIYGKARECEDVLAWRF